MRWPSLKTAPRADSPPVAWARWYRDVLGWIVLPTRCDEDVEGYRAFLLREALRAAEERGPVSAEVRARLEVDAAEEAARSRKGPMVKWAGRDFVSNIEIESSWGRDSGPRGTKRGIWVAMGAIDTRVGGGHPVIAVDVDPRSGGIPERWAREAGPIARTPSGGIHLLCLPAAEVACSVGEVAPGVDVRALGGGIVVPSGLSSPGRSWERWEPPCEAPAEVRAAKPRADAGRGRGRQGGSSPGAPSTHGGRSSASDGAPAASTFAESLSTTAPDGTRHATAATLIGILARPCSIPEDAVEPALAMLAEDGHAQEEVDQWRATLTRGPRDVEDAVAFLLAWNTARGDPPWSDSHCERVARNLWATADRREGGNAGAEDLGVGEVWGPTAMPSLSEVRARLGLRAPGDDDSDGWEDGGRAGADGGWPDAGAEVGEKKDTAAGSIPAAAGTQGEAPTIRKREPAPVIIPDGFCIPLWQGYTLNDIHADMDVEPISVAYGPRWVGWDEKEDTSTPYGYGLGTWFDESVAGGLNRGSFWSLGALTAKAGKTMFLGQLVEGLTLLSAMRLLGLTGRTDDDGPIILPFWLTEMRKHVDVAHRMIGRYLGIDISMIGRGKRGYQAPGIRQVALRERVPPEVVMAAARKRIDRHLLDPTSLLSAMGSPGPRGLTVNIDPQKLPQKRGGRQVENPRLGVRLLESTEAAVLARVREFSAAWGVDPERVIPMLILDPVHRFIDAVGEDRLTAVNAVIHKAREMAHERRWIVVCTSDTTKAGAAEEKILDGDPAKLAAAAFAGSQNLAHEPDTIIVLHAEEATPDEGKYIVERRVWVRVCLCRRSSPGPALPFTWEPHTGRYLALDPTAKNSGVPKVEVPGAAKKRSGRPPKHVR